MVGKVFMHGGNKSTTVPIYIKKKLDDNSWETISKCAKSGNAANYWDIGDCKAIDVKGRIGMFDIDGSFYVYIIGFNHNSDIDNTSINTIDFGTFKDIESGKSICFADGAHSRQSTDGRPYFNMSHYGVSSYGGWMGCDLRYDILGSTNKPPSGYGSPATSNRTGYNPNQYDIVNNPVPNTFMAALPLDLRAVMKKMTIWTDNYGRTKSSYNDVDLSAVTEGEDYLPLMSEFEVLGEIIHSNPAEQQYQKQYEYYISNSKIKNNYPKLDVSHWLTRSFVPNNVGGRVCAIDTEGGCYSLNSPTSQGLAPIFRVG